MGTISLRRVAVRSPHPLFADLNTVIGPGDRVGLIAGNGGGKTTLLRCLAGITEPGEGEIVRSRGLRVAYVEQDMPPNLLGLPMAEAIRRALPPVEREAQAWRVDVMLDSFAAPLELHDRVVGELSGGWQRLALIARAWVTEPDLLLLDEPTNHLDLAKIQLLERWITDEAGDTPMVIASHDRAFLDAATTRTLFLRPSSCPAYAHPYTKARALLADDDAALERKLAKDGKEVDRLRRNAAELKNVGVNSGSDLLQKKAMYLTKRADSLEQNLKPAHAEKAGDIRLANRGTHAKMMLALAEVKVAAPDGTALFTVKKFDLFQGDRVVLLGRNGVGKSVFVRMLLKAMSGGEVAGIRASPSIVLGYADQLMSHLPERETPHGYIAGTFRPGDQRATALLAGAGFSVDMQRRPIAQMSPGQKARLGLLALWLIEPNFYLLDEPTNHVDIAGQERLEAEILAHAPSCVLVSHDRSFVAAVATRFLLIDRGRIEEVEGPERFYKSLG